MNTEWLKEQLDILSESETDGFAISYIHTDSFVDTLFNKGGYGLFGRTSPGEPAVLLADGPGKFGVLPPLLYFCGVTCPIW